MDVERTLITRGVELCAEWDKSQSAYLLAADSYSRNFYEKRRYECAAKLDELCRIADLLGVATYDNFREILQRNYESATPV